MTTEELHAAIASLKTTVDTMAKDVTTLKENVLVIRLGIAKRSGTWAVMGKLALFGAGVLGTVIGAILIAAIK